MTQNPAVADVLYNFKQDFGWNWLGNLVSGGRGAALSPPAARLPVFRQKEE